jgi:hypothetical protein
MVSTLVSHGLWCRPGRAWFVPRLLFSLRPWAREPVALICVSPSKAAKANEMTEELKGAQDREKTASPIAATARARI